MVALPAARAAMDAHRGVAIVAEYGMSFLSNLSRADANRVRVVRRSRFCFQPQSLAQCQSVAYSQSTSSP
jgi:hypothetical protein